MQEGWLWFADNIHADEGTAVRPATDEEIQILIKALDKHNVRYEYDAKTKTIFDKDFAKPQKNLSLQRYLYKLEILCFRCYSTSGFLSN